jgi:hypothetical protein
MQVGISAICLCRTWSKDPGTSSSCGPLRGKASVELRRCQQARGYFQRILDVDPQNADAIAGLERAKLCR